MNERIFAFGIIVLAAAAFAAPSTPGVGSMMQKAYCVFNDGHEGGLFFNMYMSIQEYNSSYTPQLEDLYDGCDEEWNAMLDCTHDVEVEIGALTPEEAQEVACVSSHYRAFNGYVNQIKSLYFLAAFRDGDLSNALSDYQDYQAEYQGCMSPTT